jgi:hypothetical protein
MTTELPTITDADMLNALNEAVEMGWLQRVDRGYCFACNQEKPVYDVLMDNAPVQPPRCCECYYGYAQEVMADPEGVARIQERVRGYGAS